MTVLQLGPCPVLQVRTADRDGYDAVQLGFKDKPRKNATRAERGHVSNSLESKRRKKRQGQDIPKKADVEPQRRDPRVPARRRRRPGSRAEADRRAVQGREGRGRDRHDQGPRHGRRHQAAGLRRHAGRHGAKKVHREPGSTASLASNRGSGRPKRGKKLPGRYGNERVTIRNLKVVSVDAENNLLLVRGAVPGFNGAFVMVRPTNKK